MNNNCLSNKDLKNIAKMLEKLAITYHKVLFKNKIANDSDMEYVKNVLDHNYNYSNILNYLNHVIPQIDNYLSEKEKVKIQVLGPKDAPNTETSLPISYETH